MIIQPYSTGTLFCIIVVFLFPTTGKTVPVAPQGRCGKNACASPEVFQYEVFDAQSVDTWSVGTTLFMALLGVQPS